MDKLRLQNGARFDEAAKTAFDEGRVGLATKVPYPHLTCPFQYVTAASCLITNHEQGNKSHFYWIWNKMKLL